MIYNIQNYNDLILFAEEISDALSKLSKNLNENCHYFTIVLEEKAYDMICLQLYNRHLTYSKPEALRSSTTLKLSINNIRFKLELR